MSAFKTVSSALHYQGFSSVRVDVLEGPDGPFSREVVEHPDAVAVVALDDLGRVALVRQYRHPLGDTLLELPAGTLDVAGEPVSVAAQRELAEEAGLRAVALVSLGTLWNSAGWSDERTHLFLARRTTPTGPPPGFTARDEEADMLVVWKPLADLVRDAVDGTLTDAKTIVGVLRADAVIRRDRGIASR